MYNLVHFIHGLNMGGAETLVKEYAIGLDKNKFNLTILCVKRLHTPYEKLLASSGIHVIYISDYMPFYQKKSLIFRGINKLQRYFLSRKILQQLRPDIVHIHLRLNKFIKFAHLPKTTRIFYTQHFDAMKLQEDKSDVDALRWLIQHYPVCLIALNDVMRKQLNKLFKIKNTVILNNGINLIRFQQAESKIQIRQELGIPQNAFVLGHVGRLNPVKNQSFLIDIAAKMYQQNPNIWLLLIGDGADYAKLDKKIKASGLQGQYLILSNRSDIPNLLSAIDRFIFPSLSEGMPITLIEAQVAGLPCIVSDIVPQAVKISNLITFKSLQDTMENWIKAILQPAPPPQYTHLEEWDIATIIRQLEQLYEQ